jgi:hypothetical protein
MKPRLSLAPALIDRERVGLEHGAAQRVDALGDRRERSRLLARHYGVTVAPRDPMSDGGEMLQRGFDHDRRAERCADPDDHAGDGAEHDGREHGEARGHEYWNGDERAGQRLANRSHANQTRDRR